MSLKKCFYYYILLISCLLLIGCQDNYASTSFVKVESVRTKLINGIESYQTVDEFKAILEKDSLHWEESQDMQPPPKGRPPFNMHTITIKHYKGLGFTGELTITFFNNRLISTTFYPNDVGKYVDAIVKIERLNFDKNEARIPPYTRIRRATDHKGREYVDWSDIRLDSEVELWIKKYS